MEENAAYGIMASHSFHNGDRNNEKSTSPTEMKKNIIAYALLALRTQTSTLDYVGEK